MVTLLLGAHGCGKSTYIIDRIKEDYKNKQLSLLIVPEQQTVVAERQLTEALPPSAQLYTEATNLTRLANSVFRKTGGLKYNYITKGGQTLIVENCAVKNCLIGDNGNTNKACQRTAGAIVGNCGYNVATINNCTFFNFFWNR